MIDGIYSAYMTAVGGNGFVMFVFNDGKITGADPLGVRFDGTYVLHDDSLVGKVDVTVPPNGDVIQGASAGPAGMSYSVDISFPLDFWTRDFVSIATPLGPVNARFEQLRTLDLTA